MRILRRAAFILILLLAPVYAVSLTESLELPSAWRAIAVGDSHVQVRGRLRESGIDDRQCEWIAGIRAVRCTLVGRHHAGGIQVRFDGDGESARVAEVILHEPLYTGPFHLHARWRRWMRGVGN
jgi:hypothetical protein